MQKTDLIPRSDIDERRQRGGIAITAVTRLKHADLLAAARQFERPHGKATKSGRRGGCRGGQSALARKLKVTATELGRWINLQACPPAEPNTPRGNWSAKRIVRLETTLFEITGKTLEELFPKELRDNIKFLSAPKVFERTAHVEAEALTQYAIATRERMLLEQQAVDKFVDAEIQEKVFVALQESLGALSERERYVIEKRFGLGGCEPQTPEEIAQHFGLDRERIRQIENKALRKLGGNTFLPQTAARDRQAAEQAYKNVMRTAKNLRNVVDGAV